MINRTKRFLCGLGAAVLAATSLHAFDPITDESGIYVVAWERGTISMVNNLPNSTTFIDGTTFRGTADAALNRWNEIVGNVQFAVTYGPAGVYQNGNDINEIALDDTIGGFDFGEFTLAVTVSFTDGDNYRTESDVVFNSRWNWDSYRGNFRADLDDAQRVAIHEFGHVLGLDHPDQAAPAQSVDAIMNSTVSDIDDLRQDDIDGAQWLYGAVGFVPSNDTRSAAISINHELEKTTLYGSNIGSSSESGEPIHAGVGGGRSVWWKWTAPSTGEQTITTLGSDFDTVLAIYRLDGSGNLQVVASDDDLIDGIKRTSEVAFMTTAGEPYFIAVDGFEGYEGRITLVLSPFFEAGMPVFVSQPVTQVIATGAAAVFTAEVEGDTPLTHQWQRLAGSSWVDLIDGDEVAGAQTVELTLSGEAALRHYDRIRLVATNAKRAVVSDTVELRVFDMRPIILELSPSAEVLIGATVELTVRAIGSRELTYQWYKNSEQITGATSATFRLENILLANAGQYHVSVEGAFGLGHTTSERITLLVLPETTKGTVRVAAGENRWLQVRSSGWLFGIGDNTSSKLGIIGQTEYLIPTPIINDVVQVKVETSLFMLLKPDGTVIDNGGNIDFPFRLIGGPYRAVVSANSLVDAAGDLWTVPSGFTPQIRLYDNHLVDKVTSSVATYTLNGRGELWRAGTFSGSVKPSRIQTGVVKVGANANYITFQKDDGSIWFFGNDGSSSASDHNPQPRQVVDVVDFAVGFDHVLYLTASGDLLASGSNEFGQFGNGTTEESSQPVLVATDVWTMAAGTGFTVFVKSDGSTWAMGNGAVVPLGDGEKESRLSPVFISTGPITAPETPTGFVATPLDDLSSVRLTWNPSRGSTFYDVLRGASDNPAEATVVRTRVSDGLIYDHTVIPGTVYNYWVRAVNQAGASELSVIQTGKLSGEAPQFTSISENLHTREGSTITLVAGVTGDPLPTLQWQSRANVNSQWSDLVNGGIATGVATTRMVISGPGLELDGIQIRAVATNVIDSVPTEPIEVRIEPSVAVVDAALGQNHLIYLTADGIVWARGDNTSWQLGDGTRTVRAQPVWMWDDVVAIDTDAGSSVMVRADGTLWAVGSNSNNRFNQSGSSTAYTPVQVAENVVWAELGNAYLLWIDREGALWISGGDVFSTSTTGLTGLNSPRKVADRVSSASAGSNHAAYVTGDELWVGGWQLDGALGNGITSNSYSAGPIKLAHGVEQAVASNRNTFFRKTDGTLWGVGGNNFGIYGESAPSIVRQPLMLAEGVVNFDVNYSHIVYLSTNGTLRGIGYNNFNMLGPGENKYEDGNVVATEVSNFTAGSGGTLYIDRSGSLWYLGLLSQSLADLALIQGEPGLIASGPFGNTAAAPSIYASSDVSETHVRLSWIPRPGDLNYAVWRGSDTNFANAVLLKSSLIFPLYYDETGLGGIDYHYWVVAETASGESRATESEIGRRNSNQHLTVTPSQIDAPTLGDIFEIQVMSDTAWTVTESADWLTLDVTTGINNASITATVVTNNTESMRVHDLMINDQVITVRQTANVRQAPVFVVQPISLIQPEGATPALNAQAIGLPTPTLQWFHDGNPVSGATTPLLQIGPLYESNEGVYWLEAKNEFGARTSTTARVTMIDTSGVVSATHEVVTDSPLVGTPVEISNTVSFPAGTLDLRWTVLIPDGWTFATSTGDETADTRPTSDEALLAEWIWPSPTGVTVSFSYTLHIPETSLLEVDLIAMVESIQSSNPGAVLATPDPLSITVLPRTHSADTNGDFRFSLSELLRVIEVYNTRAGTSRTGRYRLSETTADGFAPDTRTIGDGEGPPRFHSADTSRNGQLGLSELLRVIEIYNTRSGTTRTGAYRVDGDTEDGFSPDA